jgi:L-ascorbate metabolism protein UlaG (beta-lactamase superfamily)
MQISWNGFGSFTFVAKPAQSDVTFVTNPFSYSGTKFKTVEASLLIQSHEGKDTDNTDAVTAEHPEEGRKTFVIPHAGEYEVQGVFVTGIEMNKKDGTPHTIYRFDAEGLHIAFLGALDRPLTEKEVDLLGTIDILIVPAGGKDVFTATAAAEVVAMIEPRIVIPSYVNGEEGYGTADALKRELSCPTEEVQKLKITRAGLPEEDMKLVLFK